MEYDDSGIFPIAEQHHERHLSSTTPSTTPSTTLSNVGTRDRAPRQHAYTHEADARDRRRRVYAALFGMGFSGGAVERYRGKRRKDLENAAALDETIVVRRFRGGTTRVMASDVLDLVQQLERLDREVAIAKRKRSHAP